MSTRAFEATDGPADGATTEALTAEGTGAAFLRSFRAPPHRWALLVAGLAAYGLAIALMMRGGRGLGPWDLFHQGVAERTGLSVGTVSQAVGLLLLAGLWRYDRRIGAGTLLNIVLIGTFLDGFLRLLPDAASVTVGWAMHAAGVMGIGLATGLYLGAALGAGPRDSLMLVLHRHTGVSVRAVRTGIELVVLAVGWALGGTLGLGTVVYALGVGPATQVGLRLFAPALVTKR